MSSKNHTASYCPQPAPDRRGEETHAPRRPQLPPLLQVGNVILSSELLTECFCCDLEACRGICCVEGEAGAPVTLDEVAALEEVLDTVRDELAPEARAVIDRQGVAYTDADGDLVTSIVGGRDCAFTCYDAAGYCLCATERAYRQGRTAWCKPISCSLYPIRERQLGGGLTGLSYHRWAIPPLGHLCRRRAQGPRTASAALPLPARTACPPLWRDLVRGTGRTRRPAAPRGLSARGGGLSPAANAPHGRITPRRTGLREGTTPLSPVFLSPIPVFTGPIPVPPGPSPLFPGPVRCRAASGLAGAEGRGRRTRKTAVSSARKEAVGAAEGARRAVGRGFIGQKRPGADKSGGSSGG